MSAATVSTTYRNALREALLRDERVFLMGEGHLGARFLTALERLLQETRTTRRHFMSTPAAADIRATVVDILASIAPEVDPAAIRPDQPLLREQIDLDSFDFLNVIIAPNERLGIAIPEADYGELGTLEDMFEYLTRRCRAEQP
jgi:acyl carrier protein